MGMIFRIMARNKEGTYAYAERIESYSITPSGAAFCVGFDDSCYFADPDDIVINPEIASRCSAKWLYKIKLQEE